MTAVLQHQAAFTLFLTSHPNWDVSNDTLAAWDALMSDVDAASGLAGAIRHEREVRFPPNGVAEWRRFSLEAAGQGRAALPTAAEAWEELMRNRMTAGALRYESRPEKIAEKTARIRWSSEAARRAAIAVHYDGDWTGESVGTLRAQFERYYESIVGKQEALDACSDARRLVERGPLALKGKADLYGRDYRDPEALDKWATEDARLARYEAGDEP